MSDTPDLSEETITTPDADDDQIQAIAKAHPSAGDDSQPEGVEQQGNTEGDERAADGGSGAGEDYAGSGF